MAKKTKPNKQLAFNIDGVSKSNETEKQFAADFYSEINKGIGKSCCTIRLLFFCLFLVFLLIIIGTWYLNRYYRQKITFFNYPQQEISQNIDLTNEIKQKGASLDPSESFQIILGEAQFADIIGINNLKFPLKDPTLHFQNSDIVIAGKIDSKIFPLPVKIYFTPVVVDSTLQIKINQISTSGIDTPKFVSDQIGNFINSAIQNKLNSLDNYQVTDIKIIGDQIFLTLQKKSS